MVKDDWDFMILKHLQKVVFRSNPNCWRWNLGIIYLFSWKSCCWDGPSSKIMHWILDLRMGQNLVFNFTRSVQCMIETWHKLRKISTLISYLFRYIIECLIVWKIPSRLHLFTYLVEKYPRHNNLPNFYSSVFVYKLTLYLHFVCCFCLL